MSSPASQKVYPKSAFEKSLEVFFLDSSKTTLEMFHWVSAWFGDAAANAKDIESKEPLIVGAQASKGNATATADGAKTASGVQCIALSDGGRAIASAREVVVDQGNIECIAVSRNGGPAIANASGAISKGSVSAIAIDGNVSPEQLAAIGLALRASTLSK